MVKVLQAFNFSKQYTYALQSEILAAALIDNNRVAVCAAEQFIEIYDISGEELTDNEPSAKGQRTPIKYSLATVGEVVNLIYCESANYLLTLEKETVSSPVHSNGTSSISCTSSSQTANKKDDDTKMFVRIYANFWKFPECKLIDLPITLRIASMTTPKAPILESIDVIELPLQYSPDLMQCCQVSGNIIVSSKDRIFVYEYTQIVHEHNMPRFSYIDFLPFNFHISLNFIPLKLCLAENVIVCLNEEYCVAFKVVEVLGSTDSVARDLLAEDVDNSESSNEGKLQARGAYSGNSFELASLETTTSVHPLDAGAGRTAVDFNVARMINSACGRDFEVELKSQSDDEYEITASTPHSEAYNNNMLAYPLRNTDIKIKLLNETKSIQTERLTQLEHNEETVQYDIYRLFQIGLRAMHGNCRRKDVFRAIDLRAIYQSENDEKKAPEETTASSAVGKVKNYNRRTLKSTQHHNCIAYAILVASSVDGYLYQFCAQGKWHNENEKPIAVYAFTAPIINVKLTEYWIYAVTTESVETHTSRVGHKLFHNCFEYPMLSEKFAEEASPDVNAPIAMIGLASFMHVQHVCLSQNNLVLICNSDQLFEGGSNLLASEDKRGIASLIFTESRVKRLLRSNRESQQAVVNKWTLYNLELPSIKHVVTDLEAIAESYLVESNDNYFDLMEEAHVMLRLSLSLQQKPSNDMFREQQYRALFIENCRKLAAFSMRSTKREIFLQAIGFYKLSNQHLCDIYKRQVMWLQQEDAELEQLGSKRAQDRAKNLAGFLHTIKAMLMDLGANRQQAAFLHHQVKPYFTPKRSIDQTYTNVPLSLELLNIFVRYSRSDIPLIMLHSPVVADAVGCELINYLRFITPLNPDENLLLAVSACRMSNYMLSQETIAKTSRQELAQALMRHKNVLFDDGTVLKKDTHTKNLSSHKKVSSTEFATFSDFTDTILLAIEKPELVQAICDVFIHALCIERSISLELHIDLFMNYIATHIGQKGYHNAQEILTVTLQVYFYDLLDVMAVSNTINKQSCGSPDSKSADLDECFHFENEPPELSLEPQNSESEDNKSFCKETIDLASTSTEASDDNAYDRLINVQSKCELLKKKQAQAETQALNLKAFKLLFRLYLGRLHALTDLAEELQSADELQHAFAKEHEFEQIRKESIKYLQMQLREKRKPAEHAYFYASHEITGRSMSKQGKFVYVPYIPNYNVSAAEFENSLKTYHRPIPCLMQRPHYLNLVAPFKRSDFSVINADKGETKVRFLGWNNDFLVQALKVQALLSYSKISCDVIEEWLSYLEKSQHLIGIDSFLTILLPKHLAINYMLNFSPDHLWHYGQSHGFTAKHWENLLRKLIHKKKLLPNWEHATSVLLCYLVNALSFENLLKCFPSEVLQSKRVELLLKEENDYRVSINMDTLKVCCKQQDLELRDHLPMDNIDEHNLFELCLRSAVAKQRSIALRAMIESTGNQLFDATNNPLFKL